MFTHAIVRTPCKAIAEGITTVDLGVSDYAKALEQHSNYIMALEQCGLSVTILPANENFPDSTFVEDTALLTPYCAIITNPGAKSRKREIDAMIPVLEDFFEQLEYIDSPGTVEAGDIMMVGNHYYIGLSARTNHQGAMQLISLLIKYGLTGSVITSSEVLHLKTGLSYLENNNLLVCGEFIEKIEFADFNRITVDADEVDVSEFEKIDGGLSCLSLRF